MCFETSLFFLLEGWKNKNNFIFHLKFYTKLCYFRKKLFLKSSQTSHRPPPPPLCFTRFKGRPAKGRQHYIVQEDFCVFFVKKSSINVCHERLTLKCLTVSQKEKSSFVYCTVPMYCTVLYLCTVLYCTYVLYSQDPDSSEQNLGTEPGLDHNI